MTSDCELYNHPNVSGDGCPCGRIAILRHPAPEPPPEWLFRQLPPVLAVIRGEAPQRQQAQIRTRRSSLRRPEVWA